MQTLESILYDSTIEAMTSIGKGTQEALLVQLKLEGIECNPDRVELRAVEAKLNQYFGSASPIIIEKIYTNFIQKSAAAGYLVPGKNYDLSGVDKHTRNEVLRRFVREQPARSSKTA